MYGFKRWLKPMKTLCTVLGGLAGLGFLALQGAVAEPAMPMMDAQAVAPGVWMVQGASAMGTPANRNFVSIAAFVVTADAVVVVDALGSPALGQALIATIARITPLPIRQVIVTHYHADHIYGLQAFKALGATITAHRDAQAYLSSETAALRLKISREELAPWVDEHTQLVAADRWIDATLRFTLGGVDFIVQPVGPAHTAEDLVVYLPQQRTLIAGDMVFRGRIPFVGQADSRRWISALDGLLAFDAHTIVPGHGPVSTDARADLQLTRNYLLHLRRTMGAAARNLEPFDEAYAAADWSAFDALPLFRAVNRINAYNTYLLMEQNPLKDPP